MPAIEVEDRLRKPFSHKPEGRTLMYSEKVGYLQRIIPSIDAETYSLGRFERAQVLIFLRQELMAWESMEAPEIQRRITEWMKNDNDN